MGSPVYAPKVRPSGWWYGAAALIAVGGILAGLAVAAKGVDDALEAIRSFDRTPVPGVVDVSIAEPGGYSIYQEFPGAADRGGTTAPPTLVVTDPGGAPVELKQYGSFVSYDQGNFEGRGIFTFRADQAGAFHVTAAGAPGSTIAVGRGMGDLSTRAVAGIFGGVIGGAILALTGIMASIVVAITVGIARGRSRRRQPIYVTTPMAPLAGAPTPAMATWPATPTAPLWQGTPAMTSQAAVVGSSPRPNGAPRPGWPTQQGATAAPRPWPDGPGPPASPGPVPNGVGSPGLPGLPHVAGSMPGTVPTVEKVLAAPLPGPAPVGTRVMAATGAAVGTGPGTAESTLVGPAPTLVQAGTPDGSAPTQPLSRPGDPQSLRAPVDWSRSDLELPWETEDGG